MLKMPSNRAVLLNIDKDHMECYDGEEDLISSFEEYCKKSDEAIVCADDERCIRFARNYTTFGVENPHCDYRAVGLRQSGEKYSFTVQEYGKPLCRIRLNAVGKCNVYNALAAFATARSFGFDEREIAKGLEDFTAVKRRFEKIGETANKASVICDYAHHPREIAATLETAKKTCTGDLYVVFQPHTYSRTRLLMEEFVSVLRKVKKLMIYKTYPAREYYDKAGSAKTLAGEVGNCVYAETLKQLGAWITGNVKCGDMVLFLGAGDIYYAAQRLVKNWNKN
jgi:UDP-N-acetylmuramate--alanine ligase